MNSVLGECDAALDKPQSLDPLTWLAESREASRAFSYTPEVLGPVKAAMQENTQLPTINFSEAYLQRAGNLAQVRAAMAAYRLAAILRLSLAKR